MSWMSCGEESTDRIVLLEFKAYWMEIWGSGSEFIKPSQHLGYPAGC